MNGEGCGATKNNVLKFRNTIEFQSSWFVKYLSYIYSNAEWKNHLIFTKLTKSLKNQSKVEISDSHTGSIQFVSCHRSWLLKKMHQIDYVYFCKWQAYLLKTAKQYFSNAKLLGYFLEIDHERFSKVFRMSIFTSISQQLLSTHTVETKRVVLQPSKTMKTRVKWKVIPIIKHMIF